MARSDDVGWKGYYAAQAGRPPRPLLIDVMQRFQARAQLLRAVDLGCGDGTETRVLLRAGWQVLAVDQEPTAIEKLLASVEDEDRLDARVADFTNINLPAADLIYCGWSLPHCPPNQLTPLWTRIRGALSSGGRVAGQILGNRDSWAHSETTAWVGPEQLEEMLSGLDVEHRAEVEEDRDSFDGPKHWHYYEIIARQPGPA
jgi:trans-aconitate methyltransferase